MRILGIDPGLRLTGYGLVELRPGAIEPVLCEAGVLRLPAKRPMEARLIELYDAVAGLLAEHKPGCVVIEKLYSHYAHPRTAILMAHARGVILLAAGQAGCETVDLPANDVKKAISGYGHASKEQMQRAVQAQYGLDEPPSPPDVADAIAIATCHARRIAVERL